MDDLQLDFLTRLSKALAKQFGSNCEVVIHDFKEGNLDSSITAIENGHVTHRKVGDQPSIEVLEDLSKKPEEIEDRLGYLTEADGKMIKSSTVYIRDEDGNVSGSFGINYDISPMILFEKQLQDFVKVEQEEEKESKYPYHDVNSMLDDLIKRAVKLVGRPVAYMTREDKIKAIQYLNEHGAFLITKSGDRISKYFGISKYTMYSYLDMEKL